MLKDAYSCGAKGRFAVEMVRLPRPDRSACCRSSPWYALSPRPCRVLRPQGDGSSRAITGSDFFRRHPALHPALLAHLATAVERLAAGDAGHPSLFPVLALLARLRCRSFSSFLGSMLIINVIVLANGNCRQSFAERCP